MPCKRPSKGFHKRAHPALEKGEGIMKSKTFLLSAVFVVILSITFFLSVPVSASTVTFSWGDQVIETSEVGPNAFAVDLGAFGDTVQPSASSTPAAHNPIPSTLLLLGSGLVGVVAFRKKFRR